MRILATIFAGIFLFTSSVTLGQLAPVQLPPQTVRPSPAPFINLRPWGGGARSMSPQSGAIRRFHYLASPGEFREVPRFVPGWASRSAGTATSIRAPETETPSTPPPPRSNPRYWFQGDGAPARTNVTPRSSWESMFHQPSTRVPGVPVNVPRGNVPPMGTRNVILDNLLRSGSGCFAGRCTGSETSTVTAQSQSGHLYTTTHVTCPSCAMRASHTEGTDGFSRTAVQVGRDGRVFDRTRHIPIQREDREAVFRAGSAAENGANFRIQDGRGPTH